MRKAAICFGLAVAMQLAAAYLADAANYPSRPIRMLVGFPPGGIVDAVARIVGDRLGTLLGQQVVVANRPGASGTLAAGIAVRAPADGHTLFLCPSDLMTMAALMPHMDFDPGRQLLPITMIGSNPLAVIANIKAPFNTITEMVDAARADPLAFAYGTPGVGSQSHIIGQWIAAAAHIKLLNVPYSGGLMAGSAVAAGDIPLGIFSPPVFYPDLIDAGKVKVLALTGTDHPSFLPASWPTLVESGLPVVSVNWLGLCAPLGMSDAIIARLDGALAEAMQHPTVRKRMDVFGMTPKHLGPAAFAELIRADTATYARVIRDTGIRVER